MFRWLLSFSVSTLVAAVIPVRATDVLPSTKHVMIALALERKNNGGSSVLPNRPGPLRDGGGGNAYENGRIVESYTCKTQVISAKGGRLAVRVHYVIRWGDTNQTVAVVRTIPVWDGPPTTGVLGTDAPAAAQRVNVDRDLKAYAYRIWTD